MSLKIAERDILENQASDWNSPEQDLGYLNSRLKLLQWTLITIKKLRDFM